VKVEALSDYAQVGLIT